MWGKIKRGFVVIIYDAVAVAVDIDIDGGVDVSHVGSQTYHAGHILARGLHGCILTLYRGTGGFTLAAGGGGHFLRQIVCWE